MTQLQVALKLGVTERYWRVLETLERRVPNHLVGDVAEIFGVSVDELRSWLVPEEELDEAAS